MYQESERAGLKLRIQKNQDHGNLSHRCLQIEGESAEEWMFMNYGVGEDSWESLGLQGDPTSPS